MWTERPASAWLQHMAVMRVMYLLELRVRLLEKMLTDFVDGVDVFLGLHRDADSATLAKLQVGGYSVSRGHPQTSDIKCCSTVFRIFMSPMAHGLASGSIMFLTCSSVCAYMCACQVQAFSDRLVVKFSS